MIVSIAVYSAYCRYIHTQEPGFSLLYLFSLFFTVAGESSVAAHMPAAASLAPAEAAGRDADDGAIRVAFPRRVD